MMDHPDITRTLRDGYPHAEQVDYIPPKTINEQMTELWNEGKCTCHLGFCPNHTKARESA